VADGQPIDSSSRGGSPDGEPPEKRMIGDFDSGASALWALYRDEAKSRDRARIQTLKEDMEGVLIFVRSCSCCAHDVLHDADAHSHRPVYSLRLSQRLLLTANKA
jgi:hypothetical protein